MNHARTARTVAALSVLALGSLAAVPATGVAEVDTAVAGVEQQAGTDDTEVVPADADAEDEESVDSPASVDSASDDSPASVDSPDSVDSED